eukprot:130008_1
MSTNAKREYDTSFYSIRRAHPKDLPQIIDLIISEPYFRWKELAQLMFSNIYVTVTWFIGALSVMGFAVSYFAVTAIEFKSRPFYIGLAIVTALVIFALCFMKAFSLFFVRYIRAFQIRSELQKMDQNALQDNVKILENEQIHLFWRMHTFYVAEPYDEASKKLLLGVISLTSYTDYCKEKNIEDKDFEIIAKAVPDGFKLIAHKTVVISWLITNEKFFESSASKEDGCKLRNSVYNGLLRHVDRHVVKETSINYVIVETDDFLYWQQDVLMDNQFGFCGERIDLVWPFYTEVTKEGFPNNKYFFIKICNIDPRAFEKALKKEQNKKGKELKTGKSD